MFFILQDVLIMSVQQILNYLISLLLNLQKFKLPGFGELLKVVLILIKGF